MYLCCTVYMTHYAAPGKTLWTQIPLKPRLELRRGCLVLAVLAALRREQYGYTLRKTLAEHGLEIDEGPPLPPPPPP